jgi:hypothetical protein
MNTERTQIKNNIETTNLFNKETTQRLQIEHNNRSFLSINYYGDMGTEMPVVSGVPG